MNEEKKELFDIDGYLKIAGFETPTLEIVKKHRAYWEKLIAESFSKEMKMRCQMILDEVNNIIREAEEGKE